VFYVEGGEVVLYLETPQQPENVQRIVLKTGSCLTVQLEEWHEIRNESDQPAYLLYFGVLSASAVKQGK
jgi:mannose-6-phosphate isomerase-like protein (cupin superfamily)